MNEKHLSLFQRVEDGLPEKEGNYIFIAKHIVNGETRLMLEKVYVYMAKNYFDMYNRQYYAWLNLDTLTTKKAALELAGDAWKKGEERGMEDCMNPNTIHFTDFINQNKDRL